MLSSYGSQDEACEGLIVVLVQLEEFFEGGDGFGVHFALEFVLCNVVEELEEAARQAGHRDGRAIGHC